MSKESHKEYKRAFEQFLKLRSSDDKFEIRLRWVYGSRISKTASGDVFAIATFEDLAREIGSTLTHAEDAAFIMPGAWIEAVRSLYPAVHREPMFISNLMRKLTSEEYALASLAFTTSLVSTDPGLTFWHSISDLGDSELLGNAIVAAVPSFKREALAMEIVGEYIENGDEYLSMMQNENLEIITLDDGLPGERNYYVYALDPGIWDIKK